MTAALRATRHARAGFRSLVACKAWMPAFAGMTAFLSVASVAFADTPDGKQIVLHGNQNGAMPCAACHGAAGQGNSSIGAPKLAGMPAVAIEGYLAQFAAGNGGNATMQYIAQALSPAETKAVAEYFASLPK